MTIGANASRCQQPTKRGQPPCSFSATCATFVLQQQTRRSQQINTRDLSHALKIHFDRAACCQVHYRALELTPQLTATGSDVWRGLGV